MREQPNRANDFFVGLEVPWGQDWETSYSDDCESFLVVTYNSGLPYTSATWIEKDDDGDWHIAEEYLVSSRARSAESLREGSLAARDERHASSMAVLPRT